MPFNLLTLIFCCHYITNIHSTKRSLDESLDIPPDAEQLKRLSVGNSRPYEELSSPQSDLIEDELFESVSCYKLSDNSVEITLSDFLNERTMEDNNTEPKVPLSINSYPWEPRRSTNPDSSTPSNSDAELVDEPGLFVAPQKGLNWPPRVIENELTNADSNLHDSATKPDLINLYCAISKTHMALNATNTDLLPAVMVSINDLATKAATYNTLAKHPIHDKHPLTMAQIKILKTFRASRSTLLPTFTSCLQRALSPDLEENTRKKREVKKLSDWSYVVIKYFALAACIPHFDFRDAKYDSDLDSVYFGESRIPIVNPLAISSIDFSAIESSTPYGIPVCKGKFIVKHCDLTESNETTLLRKLHNQIDGTDLCKGGSTSELAQLVALKMRKCCEAAQGLNIEQIQWHEIHANYFWTNAMVQGLQNLSVAENWDVVSLSVDLMEIVKCGYMDAGDIALYEASRWYLSLVLCFDSVDLVEYDSSNNKINIDSILIHSNKSQKYHDELRGVYNQLAADKLDYHSCFQDTVEKVKVLISSLASSAAALPDTGLNRCSIHQVYVLKSVRMARLRNLTVSSSEIGMGFIKDFLSIVEPGLRGCSALRIKRATRWLFALASSAPGAQLGSVEYISESDAFKY